VSGRAQMTCSKASTAVALRLFSANPARVRRAAQFFTLSHGITGLGGNSRIDRNALLSQPIFPDLNHPQGIERIG
jgi:hypothetical protein